MKKTHLIALGLALLVLVAVRLVRESREARPVEQLREAGIVRLAPAGLEPAGVARVEVRGPRTPGGESGEEGEPSAPLVAERSGDGWIVASAFGAPARAEDVTGFVQAVLDAAGELRGEGQATFATFGVDDAQAARVVLADAAGSTLLELRLGKAGDDADAIFVRVEGRDEVRHVRADILRRLGLWGDQRAPAADTWVEKQVLDLDEAQLARIEVERPDGRWIFARAPAEPAPDAAAPSERVEPPAAEPAPDAAAPSLGVEPRALEPAPDAAAPSLGVEPPAAEPAPDAAAPSLGVEPPAAAWTIVEPAPGWEVRAAALPSTLGRFGEVRATSILDPAATPECRSDEGVARVRLVDRDGAERVVRVGPALAQGETVVVRVDDAPFCWSLSRWSAQSLLPRASTLFEVPDLFADAPASADFDRVDVERAGGERLRLARGGDGWTLDGAQATTGRVERLLTALRTLRPEDVALQAGLSPELLAPTATVTARAGSRTLVVELLGSRPGPVPGRLVRARQGSVPEGFVAVVATTSADSLLPTREELATP